MSREWCGMIAKNKVVTFWQTSGNISAKNGNISAKNGNILAQVVTFWHIGLHTSSDARAVRNRDFSVPMKVSSLMSK